MKKSMEVTHMTSNKNQALWSMRFASLIAVLGITVILTACGGGAKAPLPVKGSGGDRPVGFSPSAYSWTIQWVDGTADDAGLSASLAFDPNGYPAISYHTWTPTYDLKYARWNGATWALEVVEDLPTNSDPINGTSLAFSPSGAPGVSYLHHIKGTGFNGKLWLAEKTGASWALQQIPDNNAVGQYSSLKYDSASRPVISYHLSSAGVKLVEWTGSAWQLQEIDPGAPSDFYSSLAIDSSDRPHVSYGTGNGQLRYARWNGASWDIHIVDSGIGAGWPYNHIQNSIALDATERPHIAYRDDLSQDLKYAAWTGSTWVVETVDSAGNVGLGVSLAMDASGGVFISYRDLTNGTVKIAVNQGSGWQIEVVDTGLGGSNWDQSFTSVALSSSGSPTIAYYDAANGDLRFATSAPLPPPPPPAPNLNQWPMLHYDIRHTGRSPYAGPQSPKIKWAFQVPTGQSVILSSPAIAEDGTIYFTSGDDRLWAVHPDGTMKWGYHMGGNYQPTNVNTSSPSIGPDGTIYVGSNTTKLFALNPDGTVRWFHDCGARILSSPTVSSAGVVYFGCYNGVVKAADAATGAILWAQGGYPTIDQSAPTILQNGNIVIGIDSVFAFAPNGSPLWSQGVGPIVEGSPAIADDGTIYVAGWDSKLSALYPNGSIKWQASIEATGRNTPGIAPDGTVYVTSDRGKLFAFNPGGVLLWQVSVGAPLSDGSWSGPIVDPSGTIFVGLGGNEQHPPGKFHAVNPNGTIKWTLTIPAWVASTPAIAADGTLYFGSHDGKLYAIGGKNHPPDTSKACATPDRLWPPNHKMRDITIGCVTDPDGDPVTITVNGITQDEPVNGLGDGNTAPDGILNPLQVRAERSGTGDGRVYRIDFTASDGIASTPGSVTVCVPHSVKSACVDSRPPEYDSTQ
jgi:outer membrane protein assembly factor BamB